MEERSLTLQKQLRRYVPISLEAEVFNLFIFTDIFCSVFGSLCCLRDFIFHVILGGWDTVSTEFFCFVLFYLFCFWVFCVYYWTF